jgi:hypothetical protein
MLTRRPGHQGRYADADQSAWKKVKDCLVAAVDQVRADLRDGQTEDVDCPGGDEVVPSLVNGRRRQGRWTYHEDRRKSQWKKKNRMKSSAARKWVALKNS